MNSKVEQERSTYLFVGQNDASATSKRISNRCGQLVIPRCVRRIAIGQNQSLRSSRRFVKLLEIGNRFW